MGNSLFELKFLIVDTFYTYVTIKYYSFEQASNMCYEEFAKYVDADNIEAIIAISNIIMLKITHKVQFKEYDIKQMDRLIKLIAIVPIETLLHGDRYEYMKECLEDDIDNIKYIYNKLCDEKKERK